MRKREVVLFFVMGSFLLSGCHTTNQDIQQNTDSTASESTSATETVRFRSQGDLFVMERQLQEELLVTVINNTDCPQNYTLSGNHVRDLLSEKAFEGAQNATVVEVPPFSAMILEKIN